MTISQRATEVRSRRRQGKPGQWAEMSGADEYHTGFNQSPQAKQITTLTISGPTNNEVYTVTINGVSVSFEADGDATTQEVVDGLTAAINAESQIRGDVAAVATSSTVVTLTGVTPGVSFDVEESESDIAVATTQAADGADPIPFGRLLLRQADNPGASERIVALAKQTLLTAQVKTITVAYVASAVLLCRVYEITGGQRTLIGSAAVTSATDRDTTLDALVTAINAALPADSVVVTADNASATALVFTAEIPGLEFEAEIIHSGGGASVPAITPANTTGPNASTSIHRALAGLSCYSPIDPMPLNGSEGEYAANAGCLFATRGKLYVECDEAVSAGGDVYIELAAGDDSGKLFASSGADRVKLDRNKIVWDRDGFNSADSVAVVRLAL